MHADVTTRCCLLLLSLLPADQATQQAAASRGLGASSMLPDDGMSAAELAAMRAELEAYKVGEALAESLMIALLQQISPVSTRSPKQSTPQAVTSTAVRWLIRSTHTRRPLSVQAALQAAQEETAAATAEAAEARAHAEALGSMMQVHQGVLPNLVGFAARPVL